MLYLQDSFGDKELPSKPLSSNDARKDVNSNSTTAAPPGDQSHIGSNGHASDTEGNQVGGVCLNEAGCSSDCRWRSISHFSLLNHFRDRLMNLQNSGIVSIG